MNRKSRRSLWRRLRRLGRRLRVSKGLVFLIGLVFILDLVLAWRILTGTVLGADVPPALIFTGVGAISTPVSFLGTQPAPTQREMAPTLTLTASFTPFLPQTFTPTGTATGTPTMTHTSTPTSTVTPSPISTATHTPSLTPTTPTALPPTAVPLPDSKVIAGVGGRNQSLPLSCESRSAVDWAHFFGYSIDEMEFQNALPRSDNPEVGFVGNPRDDEGKLPPHSYGVYAGPVADLLRSYGVPARAFHGLGFDDIRREIAESRPVIVWVVGGVQEGKRVDYTASDGQTVPVVVLEHTVMVVGYSPQVVVIQDGGMRYQVSVNRFRSSWRVLGNQAVFAN